MRKKWMILAVTAAVSLAAAGCQKYEKVELAGAIREETAGAGQENEARGAEGEPEEAQEKMPASQVSANPADRTMETAPSMEERSEVVYVNASSLNIRTAPDSDGQIIGRAGRGSELKRTGYSQSWSRVEYQGQVCYAASQYLTTSQPPARTAENGAAGGASGNADTGAVTGNAEEILLNPEWKYAGYSKINSGAARLYVSEVASRKGKVVCVNAGHGTSGGSSVKTQCHPDGTPKVTGGTTGAGATSAVAVSGGMQFADGTAEAKVTLAMAKVLKDKLLARGYDVLMIREGDDVQLDNIARTVIANNRADCHIALHWDSTSNDKGAFYMSVPETASYRSMEPVASHWQEHHKLGDSLVAGLKGAGVKIFSSGKMAMDLTQTSYSTVPSVDIELGDKASNHSAAELEQLGNGLADGVDLFFGN